jgi:hypothetical protein
MVAAEGGGETNPFRQPKNQRRKPEERGISMTDKELKDRIDYVAKLIAAAQNMRLEPGLQFLCVYHDGWCDKINGKGPCNCRPDVKVF